MGTAKDFFSIDIVLRHPSYSTAIISKALSMSPHSSWSAGQSLGTLRAKWTYFQSHLQEGHISSDYQDSLRAVVVFLEEYSAFWTDFVSGNGEVDLILNHTINAQEQKGDKCFELYLAPDFLGILSTHGIGLKVQGWQGSVKKRN